MQSEGPWKEDKHNGTGARAVIGDKQQLIALVYGETAEAQAENAKCVSAAQDFFDAAMTMAHAEDSGGDGWWRGFAMLKAALKKAGGQFPSMDQP
jgi:hypothetical protein